MDFSLPQITIPYLSEALAFLLSVVVIVPLSKKFGLSPILGYLAVGLAIGPHALAIVRDAHEIQHFAELGVIFLLFTIGLELSFERLKAFYGLIFGLGAAQVLCSAVLIGAVAFYWGNSAEVATIIGLCMALSSTAMVLQLLNERGETASHYGRSSFAILLFQDLAVVPILILLSVLGQQTAGGVVAAMLIALLKAALAIALIIVFGRYVLRHLFHMVARSHSIDVFTAMTLLAILTISVATGVAGLSMALGAFLAGLLLAETEFRHQVQGEMAPFKGLLLALFFMAVGMNVDLSLLRQESGLIALAVIGLLLLKGLVTFALARLFKLSTGNALRTAFMLAESGEFAFVVIGQATLVYALIDLRTGQFMVLVAGLSMVLTPLLAILGHRLGQVFDPPLGADALHKSIDPNLHNHIVIAGYGRVGRTVAEVLRGQALPYVAIDINAEAVKACRATREPVFVGDATRAEVLRHTGVERAAALLITMNNPEHARQALHIARQQWPQLHIIVRSRDSGQSQALLRAGATEVVPETLEASLQLSNYVLRAHGYSREQANACIDTLRRFRYREESNTEGKEKPNANRETG